MDHQLGSVLVVAVLLCLVTGYAIKSTLRLRELKLKFAPVLDIEAEVEALKSEKSSVEKDTRKLRAEYGEKRAIFDELVREAAIYDEEVELADWGVYKPHFDYGTSDEFKQAIMLNRDSQKARVKAGTAIYCTTQWTVDGNRAKGKSMVNRAIKLTARAFNNECDVCVANVRWNNFDRMQTRIEKSFDAITKLNKSNAVYIDDAYLKLKMDELRLTHEFHEKKQQEKEQMKELRRQQREEDRLQKDAEKAQKNENQFRKLLEQAKTQAATAQADKLAELNVRIAELSTQLEEAHAKSERAKSMAEQTRAGHVYVISNIGSFGKNVFKIGMTRRLDPNDRVKELGDASVPFVFDTHAIIYSEDAPTLEAELHRCFDERRLNLANNRKEFFRVTLDQIRSEVHKRDPSAQFTTIVEARDLRETIAIKKRAKQRAQKVEQQSKFPRSI